MLWDEDTEKRMVQMWNVEGLSASDIANRIGKGLTRNSVVAKAFRLRNAGNYMRGRVILQNKKRRVTKLRCVRAARGGFTPAKAKSRLELAMQAVPFQSTPDTTSPTIFSIHDLESSHCRWVYSSVGEPGFGFCGRDNFMGMSYCRDHARKAFQLPTVRPMAPEPQPQVAAASANELEDA